MDTVLNYDPNNYTRIIWYIKSDNRDIMSNVKDSTLNNNNNSKQNRLH